MGTHGRCWHQIGCPSRQCDPPRLSGPRRAGRLSLVHPTIYSSDPRCHRHLPFCSLQIDPKHFHSVRSLVRVLPTGGSGGLGIEGNNVRQLDWEVLPFCSQYRTRLIKVQVSRIESDSHSTTGPNWQLYSEWVCVFGTKLLVKSIRLTSFRLAIVAEVSAGSKKQLELFVWDFRKRERYLVSLSIFPLKVKEVHEIIEGEHQGFRGVHLFHRRVPTPWHSPLVG